MEQLVRKISWYSFLTLIIVAAIGILLLIKNNVPANDMGSVAIGGEYRATTTGAYSTDLAVIKEGRGTLGSVIVTVTGGAFNLYDATTTNPNLKLPAAARASSTLLLASFPTTQTVGTYTFDIVYNYGLLLDFNGAMGSSTITYR